MLEHNKVVENLFRSEYGKIIAILANKFGPSYLEKIEDAVQDSLLKAMQVWGFKNVPDNPTAWLLKVANNNLIDSLRRDKKITYNTEELVITDEIVLKEIHLENTISDSQLKMIFACCHPALSADYQLILSLKLIGGFGNKEIAKALLKKEETVAKSFTRAKKQLKETITTLDIPIEMGLQSRIVIVLKVIYLLFSEGYAATTGTAILKKDICLEAIRLAFLLLNNKYCKHPNVDALIALMSFHAARFDARVGPDKELIDLEHQDRTKYNQKLITIGIEHLEKAATENNLPSNYHLQAAVSYYHCTAKTFKDTDWKSILRLYDLQLHKQYSPVIQLNRIVPFYKVYGSNKAMKELINHEKSPHFLNNSLFFAIKAELFTNLKKKQEASAALKRAIELSENPLEKRHFAKKCNKLFVKI